MADISKLSIYSLGTVAVNKLLGSKEIECLPIEDLPMVNGEITDNGETQKAQAQDSTGAAYSVETPVGTTVQATWLPLGSSNRMTAPDVRRGETVALYRFADQDKFFWTTLKDDMRLRKLETVIYAFSATQDEGSDTNADTSYFLEVSTHKKLITLHTSKANGEPFAYDIQLNTAEGSFVLQDDAGNVFSVESKERRLEMVNSDGSRFAVDKKDIFFEGIENIFGKAGKTINLEADEAINFKAPNILEDADTVTTHAQWALKGNMTTAAGKGGSTGGGTMAGDFVLDGSMTAKQDLNAEGTVHARLIISDQNIQAPNV